MSLSKLFQGNADLCSQMANAAKSLEIKQQWIELAERWREKETVERLRANPNAQQLLNQPLKEEVVAPVATETPSPTLAPSQPTIETTAQTDIEQKIRVPASIAAKHNHEDVKSDMSSGLDPFWDQLLSEIRNTTTVDPSR